MRTRTYYPLLGHTQTETPYLNSSQRGLPWYIYLRENLSPVITTQSQAGQIKGSSSSSSSPSPLAGVVNPVLAPDEYPEYPMNSLVEGERERPPKPVLALAPRSLTTREPERDLVVTLSPTWAARRPPSACPCASARLLPLLT